MNDLIAIFKTISEETRLRILKLLEKGELCVCDIVAALDMIQPKVSFHLAVLKEAGFIRDRKQGRWTHYRINDSDLFKRFLLVSIFERIPKEAVAEDRRRLEKFMKEKSSKDSVVSLSERKRCAGRCK